MGKALDFLLPWDSQPQEAAQLSQDAKHVLLPSVTGDEGGAYVLGSGISKETTQNGVAYKGSGTNTQIKTVGAGWRKFVPSNADISVGGMFNVTTSGNQSYFSDGEASGSYSSIQVKSSGTSFTAAVRNSSGVGQVTTAVTLSAGLHSFLIVHTKSKGFLWYVDGVLRESFPSFTNDRYPSSGSPSWLSLGDYTSGFWNTGSIVVGYVLAGDYSSRAYDLHTNPWPELFAPRSIPVPVSAGGGPPPTFVPSWAYRKTRTIGAGVI